MWVDGGGSNIVQTHAEDAKMVIQYPNLVGFVYNLSLLSMAHHTVGQTCVWGMDYDDEFWVYSTFLLIKGKVENHFSLFTVPSWFESNG